MRQLGVGIKPAFFQILITCTINRAIRRFNANIPHEICPIEQRYKPLFLFYKIKEFIPPQSKGGNMRYLLLIFLLGIVIITGGCIGHGPWDDGCGAGWYDVTYQKCCGDVIYTNEEMRGFVCCGEKRYEQSRSDDIYYACCNFSTIYDMNRQVCCGNRLYDGTTQDCCGGTVFNINNQGCCNYHIVYNKTTQHCCNNTVGPGGGRNWYPCGGICIDYNTDSCCNQTPYSLKTQSCCTGLDGKIHEGTDRLLYRSYEPYRWKVLPTQFRYLSISRQWFRMHFWLGSDKLCRAKILA